MEGMRSAISEIRADAKRPETEGILDGRGGGAMAERGADPHRPPTA